MLKQLVEAFPTEKSQIWAFSRNIISGVGGLLFGIGILTLAQQGELVSHLTTIVDSAQKIMIEVGKIGASLMAVIVVVSGIIASFKAGFKQQVETIADKERTEAVILKDEALAKEIPSPKVVASPEVAIVLAPTPPQAEFTP